MSVCADSFIIYRKVYSRSQILVCPFLLIRRKIDLALIFLFASVDTFDYTLVDRSLSCFICLPSVRVRSHVYVLQSSPKISIHSEKQDSQHTNIRNLIWDISIKFTHARTQKPLFKIFKLYFNQSNVNNFIKLYQLCYCVLLFLIRVSHTDTIQLTLVSIVWNL